jgi:hypothetical protein
MVCTIHTLFLMLFDLLYKVARGLKGTFLTTSGCTEWKGTKTKEGNRKAREREMGGKPESREGNQRTGGKLAKRIQSAGSE